MRPSVPGKIGIRVRATIMPPSPGTEVLIMPRGDGVYAAWGSDPLSDCIGPVILANGPSALPRIRDLDKVWPGCSVTNFGAYFAAFFRYKRRYGLHAWWADDDDVSRQVIFQDAVGQYVTFLRRPDRPDRPVFYGTATPYRRESFESLPIVQSEGVGTARPVDAVQLRLPIPDDRRTPSVVGV